MKLKYMIVALFSIAATLKLTAEEISTPLVTEPTQRHLSELLAYFDEPRLIENVVVVGWLCTADFDEMAAYALEDENTNLEKLVLLDLFTKGLFLTKEDCSVVKVNESEEPEFNYSNGITLKIKPEHVEKLRAFSGQLVTLRGDYFSWHNVISMESSFKSGEFKVKDIAVGNQRFQGEFGQNKVKE